MAQNNNNNNTKLSVQDMIDASEPVTKNGDWVLPVLDTDGNQLLVSQINKTQAEKDDFATIFAEYQKAGVKVHYYMGKNDMPVFSVEQGKKLKAQRANVNRDAIIETLVASGMTQELAQATYAKMQENVKAKKSNK
jgi:predicted restriction endonuclease